MAGRALIYRWEPLRSLLEEPNLPELLHAHWLEGEPHKDACPLDPDWQRYVELDDNDLYRVWAARDGEALVGYLGLFVHPHLRYRTTLHATSDLFMLLPAYRGHFLSMLRSCEAALREIGVIRIFLGDPSGERAPIYERLGFSVIDHTYVKLLA